MRAPATVASIDIISCCWTHNCSKECFSIVDQFEEVAFVHLVGISGKRGDEALLKKEVTR